MTIAECWNQLKELAPDDVVFHMDMSAKHDSYGDRFEFNVFAWRYGMMKSGDANRCEDVVPVFRSLLLQLGDRPAATDQVCSLECELAD